MKKLDKLTDDQTLILHERLTSENLERAKIAAWIIIALELFMLARNIYNYGITWHYYVQLYLSLICACLILLLASGFIERKVQAEKKYIYQYRLMLFFYYFFLLWGVVITLIDQRSYGHVTAYLTNLMTASVLFVLPMKPYLKLQLPPLIILMVGFFIFQDNPKFIAGHIINVSFFAIFSTLGSRLMYNNYEKMFVQELELNLKNNQLSKMNEHFERLSVIDDLTQIPNRRGLYDYVEQHTKLVEAKMTIMVIDIDCFKFYNDYYGHMQGNVVLRDVATVIQKVANGSNKFAARFGGEEFVVVAMDLSEEESLQLAETLRSTVEQLNIEHIKSKVKNVITISLGYSTGVVNNINAFDELMEKADKALYHSKNNGRNQVTMYYDNITYI